MNKSININITVGSIVKVLLALALAALLWFLRDLVLILLTSVVIASAVDPAVKFFVKFKIPRVFSVLMVYAMVISLFVGIVYSFVPVLLEETSTLLQDMPSITEVLQSDNTITAMLPEGTSIGDLESGLNNTIKEYSSNAFAFVNTVFGGMLTFSLVVIFSFYFTVQERNVRETIRLIVPKEHERYAIDLLNRSQKKVGLWMQGQLLSGLIISTLTYLGLTILGVKYALLLAVMGFVFGIIPVFGIVLATIPAVAVGYVSGGLTLALLVLALYVILQQFEGNLIYPLVVTKIVGVPPLMVMLSLIVGAQVAGFLGILLSVPLAAVLQEIITDLDKWKHGNK
jgi:predicted PurR-regulated permease PerM